MLIVAFVMLECVHDSAGNDLVLAQPKSKNHLMNNTNIPRTLYQTWRTEKLPEWANQTVQSWDRLNPSYRHEIMGDEDIDDLVRTSHPDMIAAFDQMQPIQKADLFRYLILLDRGGVYADLDVACQRPVDAWVAQYRPRDFHTSDINVVVGFEIVTDAAAVRRHDFAAEFQFAQWTMAAAPGHPVLRRVKQLIRDYFRRGRHRTSGSVVRSTGPGIWSEAVALHLERAHGVALGAAPFDHRRMHAEGARVGDVLILPTRAFGLGSAGLALGDDESQADVLVRHGFQGTWK